MVSFPWIDKRRSQDPPDFFNRNTEKQRRLESYRKSWEAYLAELPDPIKIDGPSNDNVKVNPLRAIVEVGVFFMFGDEVRFELSPNRSTEKTPNSKKAKVKGGMPEPEEGLPFQRPSDDDFEPEEDDEEGFKKGSDKKDSEREPQDEEGGEEKPKAQDEKSGKKPFGADKGKGAQDPSKPKFDDFDPEVGVEDPVILEDPPWVKDLNKIWRANRKKALLNEMGLSGGIHGDVFVKFIPNGAGVKRDMPRLVLLDPANVDVITDPDDVQTVKKWIITYTTEDENGRPTTREQEITPVEDEEDEWGNAVVTSWEIKDYECRWNYDAQMGWRPELPSAREQIGSTKKWDYPWPPIEHCNNMNLPHMFWGMPDFDESAIELVQGIQRAMSSLNKIVRLHGSPRLFAKGVMPELVGQIDASPDGVITLPAGAGVDSDLKVLEALSNMSSQVEFVCEMRKQLLEALRIPPIALGDINTMSTSMSGITMAVLYAPIIQKTELKRIEYGDMLDRINKKLLVLMGYDDALEYDDLLVVWPEAMPGSSYVERQTLLEDQALGASAYTSMLRLGYDPDREAARKAQEKKIEMSMQHEFQMEQLKAQAELMPKDQFGPDGDPRGGNNNPAGKGNRFGSMGAAGNSTPKNKENPTTSRSRGGTGASKTNNPGKRRPN